MMERNRVIALSRPTGDGKTYAVVASALALEGVLLFHLPNQTLAGFMTELLRKFDADVWNLDTVKIKKEASELVKFFKALNKKEGRKNGRCCLIVVCTPRSLGGEEEQKKYNWCGVFAQLARNGILKLVVYDEAHLAVQQGLVYRQSEYNRISKNFIAKFLKKERRPHILLVDKRCNIVVISHDYLSMISPFIIMEKNDDG